VGTVRPVQAVDPGGMRTGKKSVGFAFREGQIFRAVHKGGSLGGKV